MLEQEGHEEQIEQVEQDKAKCSKEEKS